MNIRDAEYWKNRAEAAVILLDTLTEALEITDQLSAKLAEKHHELFDARTEDFPEVRAAGLKIAKEFSNA